MLLVALACISGAATEVAAQGPTVTLTLVNSAQQPIGGARARLFITSWGISDEYDLPVRGHLVQLDFTALAGRVAVVNVDTVAFIYIKADGYAPLMSEPFAWPLRPTAGIDFREGRTTRPDSKASQLTVQLRRPLPRRIRFLDQHGRAFAGANVSAAAYWNTPNHCGVMAGQDTLFKGVTDASGLVDIPDVDGAHAIVVHEDHVVFADAASDWPVRQVATVRRLTETVTTLRVRRFEPRRLSVDITDAGRPVAGAVLWADMGFGTCAAGYGPLATADARGRISLDEFFPENWKAYWVCAGGRQVWMSPDSELPATIILGVTRSAPINGMADTCAK
jgi:hypothetical protein